VSDRDAVGVIAPLWV